MTQELPSFALSAEHEALVSTVAQFARERVAPVIAEYYTAGKFPYPLVAQMAELGLFGLPFPAEHGGMGGDYFTLCLAIEQLAIVDSSLAVTLQAAVGLGALPIYRFGTADQKARWLPELCSGAMLGAFGLTEPGAGTDAGATRTTAELRNAGGAGGGEWLINGTKAFITNAGTDITGLITVTAVTGRDSEGKPEISAIIVPTGTPGLSVGSSYSKVGWCCSDTREVSLHNVAVPAANLLGERGRGYSQFLQILDSGRIAIAALATGLSQGCLDESLRYTQQREAFGHAISGYQAVQFTLADKAARTHTARLAFYDAAARQRAGAPFRQQAAIAKLHAADVAVRNARDATQLHGGYGFLNETPVARMWRDAKILEIGEGTNEVQRMVIAHELGV
ncbi:MAG: acyl-CoA dehydrogenase family protein [Mycobacteriales bacterium]